MDNNPYAAPESITSGEAILAESVGGYWRHDAVLVMDKRAQLPMRCIRSNQPAQRTLKRPLTWHHPTVYLALLVSPIVYIVLALVLRKTATVHVPLSEDWFRKRRWAILIAWCVVLLSILCFVGAIVGIDLDPTGNAGLLIIAAPVLFFGGAAFGLLRARIVTPTKITQNFVFLKGACPEFLADLPPWPHYEG